MILVVGSGFLGSYILKNAKAYYENEQILGTYRDVSKISKFKDVEFQKCDITVEKDLKALRDKCSCENLTVFYLAACHDVDYVFKNRDEAAEININALKAFYSYMPKIDKLFFASTDCVYGDSRITSKKYCEEDEIRPINVYGIQKAEAEKIVLAHNHCVVRLPFMFGPSLSGKKGFYDNLCRKLKNGQSVDMIDGMIRNALSFNSASNLLLKLSRLNIDEIPAIINMCSDNQYSKYDIGLLAAKMTGVSQSLIKKISEQEGKKFFTDNRASSIIMNNDLLKRVLHLDNII